ncbi:MAG TPA: TIGR03667 family PPOX class F420-dependent oxidoreductase [Pseudonocardiaceae bacterium]|nr:TIGR03667 family PPOX class F420-dependent oxidoreductase [Pseudonocardiaceae bacterium]
MARRLREAKVIWLTTIGRDGTPQPNPVWFLWQGDDSILTYNRPDANRLTHIKDRSRVSLNLDGNGNGGDIIVITGDAEQVSDVPAPHELPAYLDKYGESMVKVSGSQQGFSEEYGVPIRIKISRVRGF